MRLTLIVVAALLFVTTVNAQVQSPIDADRGRIAGHVVTAYAELVSNAAVTLGRINDDGLRIQTITTRTDGTGAFSFAQLPEGRYRLEASKPGYTSRQLAGADTASTATFDVGTRVDLVEDAQVLDVQVVLHRTARIAGRVIHPDGSAAPGIQVIVAQRSSNGGTPLPETITSSRFDGRYEISGLPPGEFLVVAMPGTRRTGIAGDDSASFAAGVRATLEGNPPLPDQKWAWYPSVADARVATGVTVFEGDDADNIDIWLLPAQRFNVSGRVLLPVGLSAENIAIDYGDPGGTHSGVWFVSDPGGSFTVNGIAPGPLTLLAHAYSEQGPLIGVASTEVTHDSIEDVQIVVDRPGRITGRIVYEGRVPPSGRATSIVAVQKLLKVSVISAVPESAVDANGRFDIPGAAGEFEFALDGLQRNLTIKRVMRNGGSLPMNRIGVAAGETVSNIEIVVGR